MVGDQSTGKSSVLQAITEVSFPIKDTMCTRFPVQISFRQTSVSNTSPVKATIVPGRLSEKDEALVKRIQDFVIEQKGLTPKVMEEIIEKVSRIIINEFSSLIPLGNGVYFRRTEARQTINPERCHAPN